MHHSSLLKKYPFTKLCGGICKVRLERDGVPIIVDKSIANIGQILMGMQKEKISFVMTYKPWLKLFGNIWCSFCLL